MAVFVGDPGVDDALALGVFAGHEVALSLVVAAAGNVDVETAAAVASGVVAVLKLDCPVQAARAVSLTERPQIEGEDQPFHGSDGFAGQLTALPHAPAAEDFQPHLLDTTDVFASGPLSTVSAAIEAGAVPSRVIWMGGAIAGGNITAAAEFNAWCDPSAADLVLSSGVPVDIVPLDVTTRVRLARSDIERWKGASLTANILGAAFSAILDRGESTPHDAVAAIAWLAPDRFAWESHHVSCETSGTHTRGALIVDRRPWEAQGSTQVAVDIDDIAVRRQIVESIASLP